MWARASFSLRDSSSLSSSAISLEEVEDLEWPFARARPPSLVLVGEVDDSCSHD